MHFQVFCWIRSIRTETITTARPRDPEDRHPPTPRRTNTMDIFLAILIVTAVALLSSGRFAYRLRRSRLMVVMLSGGWLAIFTGMLLGPNLFPLLGITERETTLVSPEALLESTPLLMIGLGWIGVMVGLQLRWEVVRSLPASIWKLVLADTLLSVVVFGAIAFVGLQLWTGADSLAAIWTGCLLLTAGAIGWSMETRSLRMATATDTDERLDTLIRATGALGAVLAVTLLGLGYKIATRNSDGEFAFDLTDTLGRAALVGAASLLLGVLGRYAIRIAGKDRGHQLVVFLGIVVFIAGIATQLDLPPVFAAMLTGIILANLPGSQITNFENFIVKAEFTVATLFALLAGILLDPQIGLHGLGIAFVIALARILIKPVFTRWVARRVHEPAQPLPASSPLYLGSVRPNPIAIALAVSVVLLEPSTFNTRLLTIVILSGLLCELIPIILGRSSSRSARSEAFPENAAAGATA